MEARTNLGSLLKILPPVDFCCVYGSSIHPNNNDKSSMEDYILGVSNPQQWHSENLKMNRVHYASWMASVGGAELITKAADRIGVGVHFNPFVSWNNKMYKYGVVSIDDLVEDMLSWKRFYLSGRLQKPVRIIVDNKDITNTNLINLRAASSAALLLLPSKFTERELYAKICSLSYMGDLRMLFAEDKNKIKKIVEGQFELFRNMYKPLVEEYAAKQLLRLSSCGDNQMNISQDYSLSATSSVVSSLPESVRSQMGMGTVETKAGQISKLTIGSREEAAALMQKVLRRRVMISSARQAVAGFIAVGAVHGVKYLGKKMMKAWKSSSK
ncbi:putative phosphatidate cytidylyltransferase [Helianthus annuus]|uniref:Phosphatidate cytidylyltransferase, mitochondrial n=2 Tax=Helianthus annuus TaxID=4232 RepID=A0A251T3J1_HELAN|nr:phosphatidate cytidylyltransferase, mitochondrial isoform X1 [Helianthus annuus]XP_021997792.1 phosphatidate cytidylyltransferase, mitochondrial isoform X1 [Helianthus annuus]XP_021997793.1 phosphatidate cytidylyltransferase, mitochondrial isoform X1 [Helianthus annuus]XP_021997794.1 phosphatidate cytidylyltransferase, mitochondrial isoform X1 [Helianthus annuus]XP_021997795.1 phosphatidate cytidylyltransferase, mitochondrial isoform X1 [Helianthus annuus]XP_021997796.1 phosphatidate cytidy